MQPLNRGGYSGAVNNPRLGGITMNNNLYTNGNVPTSWKNPASFNDTEEPVKRSAFSVQRTNMVVPNSGGIVRPSIDTDVPLYPTQQQLHDSLRGSNKTTPNIFDNQGDSFHSSTSPQLGSVSALQVISAQNTSASAAPLEPNHSNLNAGSISPVPAPSNTTNPPPIPSFTRPTPLNIPRHHSPTPPIKTTQTPITTTMNSKTNFGYMSSISLAPATISASRFYDTRVCNGRFVLKTHLGSGSFGEIYWGIDTWGSREVAIKLEQVKARQPQLLFESRIYKLLHTKTQGYHPSITRSPATGNDMSIFASENNALNEKESVNGVSVGDMFGNLVTTGSFLRHSGASLNSAPHSNSIVNDGATETNSQNNTPLLTNSGSTTRNPAGRHGQGKEGGKAGANNIYHAMSVNINRQSVYKDAIDIVGFPECHYYGVEGDYNILVMDLLGPNLEDLFNYCNRQFTIKTICLLADQMLHRLEYLHHKGFIHRDLKPENFTMGGNPKRSHIVHLIDFGLSKRFWDQRTNQHIIYKEGKALTGTVRYCSVNAHLGIEQSRRDDLESLGYILLYFMKKGFLPWQGIRGVTDPQHKNVRISEKKISTSLETLCRDEPVQIYYYMKYARDLKFEETPDYKMCREWFAQLLEKKKFDRDWVFDWVIRREQEMHQEKMEIQRAQISSQSRQQSLKKRSSGRSGSNKQSISNADLAASRGRENSQRFSSIIEEDDIAVKNAKS